MAKKVKIYHINEQMKGKPINLPEIGDVIIDKEDGSVEVSSELAELLVSNSPSWRKDPVEVEVQDNEDGEIKEEDTDPELQEDEVEEGEDEETEEEDESDEDEEDGEEDEEEAEEAGEFPKSILNKEFSFNELKELCKKEEIDGYEKIKSKKDLLSFLEENWHAVSDESKADISKMK